MSHEIAAMSFSRNHSRHDRCIPGWGDTRGTQSGCALRKASSPLRTTTTSPGSTFTPSGRQAVEVGVDRAPGSAGRGEAVSERAAVEQLAVPSDVTESVDVGDREPGVNEVKTVEHDVSARPVRGEGDVVHDRRLGADVARQVIELLEVPFDAILRGRCPVGYRLAPLARGCVTAPP